MYEQNGFASQPGFKSCENVSCKTQCNNCWTLDILKIYVFFLNCIKWWLLVEVE